MTKAMIDEMVESLRARRPGGRKAGGGWTAWRCTGRTGTWSTSSCRGRQNLREDEYGGSFENRLRFASEILDAVRAVVGPDFTMGLRLSSEEFVEDGLTPQETAQIAVALQDKIDYLNVSYRRLSSGPDCDRRRRSDMPTGLPAAVRARW